MAAAEFRRGRVDFDYIGHIPLHLRMDDPNEVRLDLYESAHGLGKGHDVLRALREPEEEPTPPKKKAKKKKQ